MTNEELKEKYDEVTYEHLLFSFAKQAVNGLCASGAETPKSIAQSAFEIAEACIAELAQRTRK